MSRIEILRMSLPKGVANITDRMNNGKEFGDRAEAYAAEEGFKLSYPIDRDYQPQPIGETHYSDSIVWTPEGWREGLLPQEFLIKYENHADLVLARYAVTLPIDDNHQLVEAVGAYLHLFRATSTGIRGFNSRFGDFPFANYQSL